MKVQMREIIQAIPALSKITGGDLSLRLAYQLKRNIAELQKEADFFSEQRQKIFAQIAITSWTPRGKNLGHGWSRRIYP